MTVIVKVSVSCNTCGWWDDRTSGTTRAEAIEKAKDEGWTVAGNSRATCPSCQVALKAAPRG